jgi:hypothetical protein
LWWGDIGHGYEDYRTWPEILARGPRTDACKLVAVQAPERRLVHAANAQRSSHT